MIPLLSLCVGACVVAGSLCLSAKDTVPACTVNDVEVFERQDVDGKPMISGVFRIEAPKGFWLPEPAFLIWKHDHSRSLWHDRFAPRWIAMDSQGKVVPKEDSSGRDVQAMFSFRMEGEGDGAPAPVEGQQRVRPVTSKEIPELSVEGRVHAAPRFWLDGKLKGEVQMMMAPRKFMRCEASPIWQPSPVEVEGKVSNPACEMHVMFDVKEMQEFAGWWLQTTSGYWTGRDGAGVAQTVSFMPDYKPQPGDVFYMVSFTARDRVFRNVKLVPAGGDASAVRLIGFSMMEVGANTRGQWKESYLFVMPRVDGKARVRWEEQRVLEVRVPVLLDMADVPWRRK